MVGVDGWIHDAVHDAGAVVKVALSAQSDTAPVVSVYRTVHEYLLDMYKCMCKRVHEHR